MTPNEGDCGLPGPCVKHGNYACDEIEPRQWKAGDVIPSWGDRPLSVTEANDLNRRELMAREPDTKHEKYLSAAQLMWLRHLLQMLSEQSRTVRDSIAPATAEGKITATIWEAQWHDLKREMDAYTMRLLEGKEPVTLTKFLDHNE